ncbi:hypothetical protein NE237_001669 [Protea cynaroides]|uniref:PH domain-containing protein n=1 Tax=Protea cynaroides TaxID=273540 RepID=A0A9Q0KTJ6_9MAGN|nr:hypothetical protein NE237_001669 [Protea cynaroides]
MASNGTSPVAETENSLEKIKRQLTSGSGRNLLQGPLLKRSERLKNWNERWVILDPTTGKMEYKMRRNESVVKGTILFDANSTITISPVNFHGLPKYDGCCFYIGTPQRKDYFLCAETPGAARAWVSTLHATQLVLKAHKEAVNSLSGNGSAKLGTVATVVAAANSTAREAAKEIEAAMRISLRNALGVVTNRPNEGQMDNLTIMKETMQVKDEELQQLARDLRARDSTIKELAEKLSDTAEAAETAASAAHTMDKQRRIACAEIERLTKDSGKQLDSTMLKLRASEEKVEVLSRERDQLLKQRDSALQEAHLWRSELAKARERAVIMEGAIVRAEERVRVSEADAEARVKEAVDKGLTAVKEKEKLLAYVNMLQGHLQRQQSDTKQVFEETVESCSDAGNTLPLTKHVDLSEGNADKACLSISKSIPVSEDGMVQLTVDQADLHSIGDGEWSDIRATEARIADVRISPEEEGSSLDIPVSLIRISGAHLLCIFEATTMDIVIGAISEVVKNNCKVILTTRQLHVCNQMKTQLNVKVKVLSERDAWVLFKWAVGDRIEDDNALHPIAKQIVKECGGLPLAIITIGRALQVMDQPVWEDAANQLKKSSLLPPDVEGASNTSKLGSQASGKEYGRRTITVRCHVGELRKPDSWHHCHITR